MTRQFDVVVEKDSDGYFVASVPALPGCHTQAKSLDDLMERVREAIALCLEVQGDVQDDLDFVGVQRVTVNARPPFPPSAARISFRHSDVVVLRR
ncbi:MAG: type II toxin-antitoxin system HicB family antitoxin [Proteobacteria bacterium]|nr:type II toxin-antitoxin system HicB family antitoxin [Pseudomonadota bacterium]